jgi:hypothetical protein
VRKALASAPVPVEVLPFSAVSRLGVATAQERIAHWLGLESQP